MRVLRLLCLQYTSASALQLLAARQMKSAVSALQCTFEDAAVQRRRSRKQQADTAAAADVDTHDSDLEAPTAHTEAGSKAEQQQQPQPHKERQIVEDLGKLALLEYRRGMAAQQRQAKSIKKKLQLLRQAWMDAEPPGVFDGATIVGGFEAAVQLNVQYRWLLEDIKQQQQRQATADAAPAATAPVSTSSRSRARTAGKADAAPADAAAAASASLDFGAWRRTREAVLQHMKVKELQAVLEAAGWEPPPKKFAKSKKALMQVGWLGMWGSSRQPYEAFSTFKSYSVMISQNISKCGRLLGLPGGSCCADQHNS
jgi:hypothetical protein